MTNNRKTSVLLVEDTPSLARVYMEYLRLQPYDVTGVETGKAALDHLAAGPVDVVLLDLHLPDMDGMEVLKHVRSQGMPTAVVVITAHGSVNVAVAAMREGAYDFLVKPFAADRLRVTIENALERLELQEIVDTYRHDLARSTYHGFIGSSLVMQGVYRIIDSAAASKATVFITGESGTGKEVCAGAIHKQSERRGGPFIAINCGAIPKDLMESEIFGHVKGAFTGATSDRDGAAAQADGGTLFLDEICEMDPNLQTKLLRFIQTGTFQRVGGTRLEKTDIRIVCATNRDPVVEVAEGRFREDLFYRLHVIPVHLPPLRDRDDDLVEIARTLLQDYAREENKRFDRFAQEVEADFRNYPWPGNVRQLQNVIRNIVVLHDGEEVDRAMVPPPVGGCAAAMIADAAARAGRMHPLPQATPAAAANGGAAEEPIRPLWQIEKRAIERAIDHCGGNIPRAAALLEISPSTIYRKKLAWEAEGKG